MQTRELFPLELTPFEKYMLADDRDTYPMSFSLQFEFRGAVQPRAWEASLSCALARHPLLTALVRHGREWHQPNRVPHVAVRWESWGGGLSAPEGERIDLTHEPGLRIWTQQDCGQARVTYQAHHASCDAFGLIALMEDWLLAYEAELDGGRREPLWEPIDPWRLTTRGASRWPTPLPEPVSRWKAVSSMCSEAARWAFRRPMPLRAEGTPESRLEPFPGIQHCTLSQQITERLFEAARTLNVTLNDLLLLSLFVTLREWNLSERADRSRQWLLVNVPTSLRTSADEAMPAANVLGYAFIARRGRMCRDANELLRSIAEETAAIRKWNLGQNFLDSLATAQRLPGLLSWLTSPSSCRATTVLSNLGNVSRRFRSERLRGEGEIGGLTLERLVGTPPLRPFTRAAFMVATCRGQLSICTRWDHRSLDEGAGRRLLGRFVDNVEHVAAPTESISRHCLDRLAQDPKPC